MCINVEKQSIADLFCRQKTLCAHDQGNKNTNCKTDYKRMAISIIIITTT